MSDEEPEQAPRPSASYPPQPHQVLTADHGFTPNFLSTEQAKHFPGRATPHLWNMLKHPPEEFAGPRNPFPGTDPIMDARGDDAAKPGGKSYEQVAGLKDIKDIPVFERHARDATEFSVSPPDALTQAQKQRWTALRTELFNTETDKKDGHDQDPYKMRPRGELRKLKELAKLAGGKKE